MTSSHSLLRILWAACACTVLSAAQPALAQRGGGKALLLEKSDDWAAYAAQNGKDKICYAMSQPKDRQPGGLNRDPAYFYIWQEPGKNVRNEISVILGFPSKTGGDASATIGAATFQFATKDASAFLKNPAESGRFIDALRKGERMVLKATSARGNTLTDTYSLDGVTGALARAARECP
ncbi:MAG: invasion associated locus B family protein [Beijerinckiaceae bacterium]